MTFMLKIHLIIGKIFLCTHPVPVIHKVQTDQLTNRETRLKLLPVRMLKRGSESTNHASISERVAKFGKDVIITNRVRRFAKCL